MKNTRPGRATLVEIVVFALYICKFLTSLLPLPQLSNLRQTLTAIREFESKCITDNFTYDIV